MSKSEHWLLFNETITIYIFRFFSIFCKKDNARQGRNKLTILEKE